MTSIERILVPVDFSPCAEAALEYAIFVGERFDATIHVLHVREPVQLPVPELAMWRGDGAVAISEFGRTQAGKALERILARLERRGLRARGRLETGDPFAVIVRLAFDEEFDLIVMGTHGRTGLAHLLSGSVAEKVVRRASCPVMTIRAPDAPPDAVLGVMP